LCANNPSPAEPEGATIGLSITFRISFTLKSSLYESPWHLFDDAPHAGQGEAVVVGLYDPLQELVAQHFQNHAHVWPTKQIKEALS
jgi:hypothetical protein